MVFVYVYTLKGKRVYWEDMKDIDSIVIKDGYITITDFCGFPKTYSEDKYYIKIHNI